MTKRTTEIRYDIGDVVVTDNGIEVFRKSKTPQTIAIARNIYYFHKYNPIREKLSAGREKGNITNAD